MSRARLYRALSSTPALPAAVDPSTPAEWLEAVNLAEFYLLLDSARHYGLVVGGPDVDVERCLGLQARGRAQGVVPITHDVDALIAQFAIHNARQPKGDT